MRLLGNLDEKVIVTRGYLAAWSGMVVIFAGITLTNRDASVLGYIGLGFVLMGLAILISTIKHLSQKPQPLDPSEKGSAE